MIDIYYHADCWDGVAAAYIALQRYPTATTHPARYGHAPESPTPNSDILILDFCYPENILRGLAAQANSLVVLDHHPLAIEIATKCPDLDIMADPNRCGAALTWDYLYPEDEPPWWLCYFDDYDRWQWKLEETDAFTTWRSLYPTQIVSIHEIANTPWTTWLPEGSTLIKYRDQLVAESVERSHHGSHHGHAIRITNTIPTLVSHVGNYLAEISRSGCAVTWFTDSSGDYQYSVRSVYGCKLSARELATTYGGNGHKHASGFTSDRTYKEIFLQ